MGTAPTHSRGTNWREHYKSRMVGPEEVAAQVSSGNRIYVVTSHESAPLLASLLGRADELRDVEIRSLGGLWTDYGFQNGTWAHVFRANMSFGTPASREAIEEGITNFTVVGFGDAFRHINQRRAGSEPFDFCWFTVTPPNDAGYCCVGAEVWDLRIAMKNSKINVAAVNDHLPRTFGDTWIHVSEIDYFIEDHEPFLPRTRHEPTAAAVAIAQHVSGLVRDRDTLQIGTGSTSGTLAQLGAFNNKQDLGYFSEMSVAGLIDLVDNGVITSKYSTVRPNKFATTGLTGGLEEYNYVNNNPFFEFYDYDYMLNPAIICQNENMVSINNGLSIDLRGQINLVSMGPKIWSGSGGQLAFHTGAFLSRGGRAITVMPSTASKGTISRIVPEFPAGQVVTIPWDLADTVVTEFGVAELLGKTMSQRAQALIEIAHPDHQPELRRAASKLL
ncbi:4-hydroxybutyrate coenzyme A transferase [Sphingobium indicum BiD32]|uniref:4-hydroxybutyrate coenzyme A transferase n=1 Tax=Sphingobium indicum BiD32 TaxID=1301087 RepID=N1MH43_9SPHN|nr:acetyl-CoA hydrolase/transferase C-terminal domain-containing protein [Sphingobium indicum]CCW16266.1 4-hydroxybutyrate coenzyme A transferase [Sphingobium indicum BiD32]